jgi:predicted nucleic acid-binding protein
MSSYLLDSDSLIFLLKQNPGMVAKVGQAGSATIALSVISAAEILHGAYYSSNPVQNLKDTRNLISQFQVIDLNQAIADKYGEIKAILKQNGQLIADFDLLIAATALIGQRTLVTNNLRHFSRLTTYGLTLENWKS